MSHPLSSPCSLTLTHLFGHIPQPGEVEREEVGQRRKGGFKVESRLAAVVCLFGHATSCASFTQEPRNPFDTPIEYNTSTQSE